MPVVTCSTAAAGNAGAIPQPTDSERGGDTASKIRGLCFYLWTLALSIPLFVVMLVMAPFVMLRDKVRRNWQHEVNNIWARASTTPWYRVEVEGWENLPAKDEAAVYISNHQSFLDIFSLFHLDRPFKFVSKTSNFYIPIVGWSMFLTGHVMINRMDTRSMMQCLLHCGTLLKQGASVLFFPEGTRSKDGKMASFKKGAFSVAVKTGSPVVPITLVGTGKLMPNGQESRLYGGRGVKIIVHPRIQSKNADEMCDLARKAIASRLPPSEVA
jgi:1-acyl-sn-glycerol-3-phosphate acyltransferase